MYTYFFSFFSLHLWKKAYYRKTPLHYTTLCIHVTLLYDFKDKVMKFCDFFPLTDIIFDVYGMTPIEIEIVLMRDFDFHGFLRYGEGRFTVLCPD